MGNILQIRLICATPNLEAARARWPRLCAQARDLYSPDGEAKDAANGLFLPHWAPELPMPGARELAEILRQLALILPQRLDDRLSRAQLDSLTQNAEMLGDALGSWKTDEAAAALARLTEDLDALEAGLHKTPPPPPAGPAPAKIIVTAVTWSSQRLEKTCPLLCAAMYDAEKREHPDETPPPPDAMRLLDFLQQAQCAPEVRERLKAPLARAEACRAALDKALRDGDPRAANRYSNDMDDILEELEDVASCRPAGRKGILRRLFG